MTPRKLASVVAVLVALMAALVWFNAGREVYDAPLDPANPKQDGAQALAKVLDQQGIDLSIARGRAALEAHTLDADTTVVVTSAELLGRSTFKALRRAAGEDARIIVVASAFDLDPALRLPSPVSTVSREVAASCDDPLVTDLTIYVGSDFDPGSQPGFIWMFRHRSRRDVGTTAQGPSGAGGACGDLQPLHHQERQRRVGAEIAGATRPPCLVRRRCQ
ncbi:MAG: DUF4350 domain-containing protein [Marmoricola sp.]